MAITRFELVLLPLFLIVGGGCGVAAAGTDGIESVEPIVSKSTDPNDGTEGANDDGSGESDGGGSGGGPPRDGGAADCDPAATEVSVLVPIEGHELDIYIDDDATVSGEGLARLDLGKVSGRHYVEIELLTPGNVSVLGVGTVPAGGEYWWLEQPGCWVEGVNIICTSPEGGIWFTDGPDPFVSWDDVLRIAVDADEGHVWFGGSAGWFLVAPPSVGPDTFTFGTMDQCEPSFVVVAPSGGHYAVNAGQRPFSFPVPPGFRPGWFTDCADECP